MKEIVKGFEILKTRKSYLKLEDSPFPVIYSLFYSTFDIGMDKMYVPGVFLPDIKQVAGILNQQIDIGEDFLLYDFLTIEESQVLIRNTYDKADDSIKKYWPIAECDANKNLVVGIDSSNNDQIYLENLSLFPNGERYKLLSGNIFEFMTYVTYVEDETISYGIKSYADLYKNWGEDFWRVKGE